MSTAQLSEANLRKSFLHDADLNGAAVFDAEDLEQQVKSLERATKPNGQKYEDWLKSKDHGEDGKSGGSP